MGAYIFFGQIALLLSIIIGLWLGFWVYWHNKKNKANQLFLLFTFFLLVWIFFGFLITLPDRPPQQTILWVKIAYLGVLGWLVTTYFFLQFFPSSIPKKKITTSDILFLMISGIMAGISLFTDLLVKDVEIKDTVPVPILGEGLLPIYFGIILITIFILKNLFQGYLRLSRTNKLKTQYFLVGLLFFIAMNIVFNILLSPRLGMIPYAYIGNYSVLVLLGFTAYAIVKRELFDIKVALTSFFVGLIALLLFLDLFMFTKELWIRVGKGGILVMFLAFGWLLIKSVLREIKQREALAEAYVKLQQLDKAKTEFLSIASHQLRTPLTAVKGYISMLLEKTYGAVPEKMIKPLRSIYSSNERLIKLVNDLLNVSRIEAGKTEKSLEKTSLQELAQNIVEELKLIANAKNLYLKFEEPEKPLPEIFLDKDKIRQVVMNIIDNAIKYTEHGGVTVKIREKDKNIQISISDTGDGLSQEEVDHLFTSFTRGKAGTRLWVEGAGLGLYIAKKFIDMHNGKIWAESQGRGQGSVFYIELPIELSE